MPSLKDLRKRVRTVKSTQQITKAMKMVAAAKLRRAQDAAERARPYAGKLTDLLAAVSAGFDPESMPHPLLARREERCIDLVVLTSDRGLCGGFNAQLLRRAEGFLRERAGLEVKVHVLGKKGIEYFRRRAVPLLSERQGVLTTPVTDLAGGLARSVVDRFINGETDGVYLAYSKFRSAISQVPTVSPLLPVAPPAGGEEAGDYIFEPTRPELLGALLPRYIEALVSQAVLESIASEHGARMTAMESATNNASDMIERLTLLMNRTRQAAITKELMEIVSGAEALKG
jgi:F-type H+-transporting ATPase subunit gamma